MTETPSGRGRRGSAGGDVARRRGPGPWVRIATVVAAGVLGASAVDAVEAPGLLAWPAAVFLAYAVLWLLVVLTALPFALARRRPALVGLLGVAAALCLTILAPRLTAGDAPGDAASVLRLTTWNGFVANPTLDGLDAVLAEGRPDVTCLFEVGGAAAPALRALVDRGDHTLAARWLQAPYPGVAVLVRSGSGVVVVDHDITWPAGSMPLVTVDLLVDDRPLRLVAVHPQAPTTPGRHAERAALLAAVDGVLRTPHDVVCGDLNAVPWERAVRELRARNGLADAARGGLRATWPGTWPPPVAVPIDHVLTGPGWRTASVSVGAPGGSDHRPLHVVLAR